MAKPIDLFKNRLEDALAHANMKPVDLAKRTGISEATISQYRSGYSKPKNDRVAIIAEALNVRPEWLMGFDVSMENKKVEHGYTGYYPDDIKEIADFLFENPDYKSLFQTTSNVRHEDIDFVREMIERVGRK